jgi:hypothetical protein
MFRLNFSQLTQFHENPSVIAWWRRVFFRFLHWFSFEKRRVILAIGALWVAVKVSREYIKVSREYIKDAGEQAINLDTSGLIATVTLLLLFLWLVYIAAVKFAYLPSLVKKHPLYTLHLFYWLLLFILWGTSTHSSLLRNVLFVFALMFPTLIWRCSYVLLSGQQGRATKSKFSDHLLTLLPLYGGSETPYGKGFDFLSKFEAKDELALAKSQLAGLKLFLLAEVWKLVRKLIEALIYGPTNDLTAKLGGYSLEIPKLSELVKLSDHAPLMHSWLSIYLELFIQVLHHAADGLVIIGFLRFFGFHVFRNTYKPLLAESIVEFWNRYYYYFKELLANFFFMPTFMQLGRVLKNNPSLRLFLAVFAAAFVGDMYYHIIQNSVPMALGNISRLLLSFKARAFYCFLLAFGIFISMLREQRRAGQPRSDDTLSRYARIFSVWTFFAIIYIWNVRGNTSFTSRTAFFVNLLGLN